MIIDFNYKNIKKYKHGDIIITHTPPDEENAQFNEEEPCGYDEFFLYIETQVPYKEFYFDLENGNVLTKIDEESIVRVIPFEDVIITREEED